MTVGSFNRVDVRGVVNAPINDQMAMTISGSSRTDSGYYYNAGDGSGLNRKDTQSVRMALVYNVTDDFSALWSADFSRDHSGANLGTPFTSDDPLNTRPIYCLRCADPALADTNRFSGWGSSLTLDWNVGIGKLSSITAYRQTNFVQADNLSGVPWDAPPEFTAANLNLTRYEEQHQLSQEIQFTSTWDGPLSLTSGVYYFHEYGNEYLGFLVAEDVNLPFSAIQKSTSEAAYSELTYKILDPLSITAGGRYTHDSKNILRGGLFDGVTGNASKNEFTPRVMLSYQPAKDYLLYASWARGYQEGEFQPFPGNAAQAAAITDPQKVTAYEVGAKTEWFDHRLRANAAAFRNTYTDLATGVVGTGSEGALVTETAADLRSQGVEVELTARVLEGLTLNASYARDQTRYLSVSGPYSAANPQVGQPTKNTPLNTARFGANYNMPLTTAAHAEVGGNIRYQSSMIALVPALPWYYQGGYALVDARLGYVDDKRGWSVTLGGENLTNKVYFTQSTLLSGPMHFIQPGRTWSLQFAYSGKISK